MMRSNQAKFKSIWNYIILRFQHQNRSKFVFHKKSIKLCKKKKYKNPFNDGQSVQRFVLPKEMEVKYFKTAMKKLKDDAKKEQMKHQKKDVSLNDIMKGR